MTNGDCQMTSRSAGNSRRGAKGPEIVDGFDPAPSDGTGDDPSSEAAFDAGKRAAEDPFDGDPFGDPEPERRWRFSEGRSDIPDPDDDAAGRDSDAPAPAGQGVFLRNVLVATATVPFAFLLVLIAAVFLFGAPAEPQAGRAAPSVRIALAEDALAEDALAEDALAGDAAAGDELANYNAAPAPDAGDEESSAPRAEPGPAPMLALAGAGLPLPDLGGEILSVGLDGSRLALLVEAAEGRRVVIYDTATRTIIASLGPDGSRRSRGAGAARSGLEPQADDMAPFPEELEARFTEGLPNPSLRGGRRSPPSE